MAPPTPVVAPPPAPKQRSVRAWHDEIRRRQREGDVDGAVSLLRRLIDTAPPSAHLRRDLITLLRQSGDDHAADCEAVRLDPADRGAWARICRHARVTGDIDAFVAATNGWEQAAPGDPVVGHFAAIARSVVDGVAPERASDGYVRAVFDQYADRFDDHLGKLRYRGPDMVADLVADLVHHGDLASDAAIADLGCGTGLVGLSLRGALGRELPWRGRLTGNDLSPRMLERSTERRLAGQPVYDDAVEADFVTFLRAREAAFDAIVGADSLIYVGDLRPVFAAASEALRPGGYLVATLEHADRGQAAVQGYAADLSGRYAHDGPWVEQQLVSAGFVLVVVEELSVRIEARRPVPGLVLVARLPR